MRTITEKSSKGHSLEDLLKQYVDDGLTQGQLFGASEMDEEVLVEAYLRSVGKRRVMAFKFILERSDSEK